MKHLLLVLTTLLVFTLSGCKDDFEERDLVELTECIVAIEDAGVKSGCTNADGKFLDYIHQYDRYLSEFEISSTITITYDNSVQLLYVYVSQTSTSFLIPEVYGTFEDVYTHIIDDITSITDVSLQVKLTYKQTDTHYVEFFHNELGEDKNTVNVRITSSLGFMDEYTPYKSWITEQADNKEIDKLTLQITAFDYNGTVRWTPASKYYEISLIPLSDSPRYTDGEIRSDIKVLFPSSFSTNTLQ